jgi:hypothetical protein
MLFFLSNTLSGNKAPVAYLGGSGNPEGFWIGIIYKFLFFFKNAN